MPRLPVRRLLRPHIAAIVLAALPGSAWATTTAPKPSGYPGSWVTQADYPAKAWKEKRAGTTYFALQVSAEGKPESCRVTVSSGSADLDAQTCVLMMKRAKFKPAKDVTGKAVPGTFESGAVWVIPPI